MFRFLCGIVEPVYHPTGVQQHIDVRYSHIRSSRKQFPHARRLPAYIITSHQGDAVYSYEESGGVK
jgi:hypothetical protein